MGGVPLYRDEAVVLVEGQCAQDHRIHDGKNRRRRADPERERQDRDEREDACMPEGPQRIPDIT